MFEFNGTIRIGKRTVGTGHPTYVIAEVGSNHDGSLEKAKLYVHAAAKAGADAVKFQSFSAGGLVHRAHPAFSILEKLTVPDSWHDALKTEADKVDVEFLSAPFEISKARLLKTVGCRALKIASGELTHTALLKEVGGYGIPLVLSTGAALLHEIEHALQTLFDAGARDVVLLHCVSSYPPRFSEMNVRAVSTLAKNFGLPVGISDHTPGHTVPLLSLGLGGCMVEKHVTFDRALKGPDHPFAVQWEEFATMVQELRHAESALGDGKKVPTESEKSERLDARKGLYTARELRAGETLTAENTKLVRQAKGISALEADKAYGKKLNRSLVSDTSIVWKDLDG